MPRDPKATGGGVRQPKELGAADPEQYRRFVKAARELGCDEDKERFEQVVWTLAKAHMPSAAEMKASGKAHPKAKRDRKL